MKSKKKAGNQDFFDKVNSWLQKRQTPIFIIFLILTALFGALLFNLRVSEGGDDSTYIVNARQFLTGEHFPTHLGSFYPIFLSLFLAVFGINLFVLKLVSYFLVLGSYYYFYKAFKDRIPAFYLSAALIFYGISSELLYFASQTYSEALFLLLQAVSFYAFFKFLEKTDDGKQISFDKNGIKLLLFLGFFVFLMAITRLIGYGMLLSILVYLLFKQRFRAGLGVFLAFLVFQIPFILYKNIFWDVSSGSRIDMVLQKNPYNPNMGMEDFGGMVTRVIENAHIYLSRHVPAILGWRESQGTENIPIITIIIIILFIIGFIFSFRKKDKFWFLGIYLLIMIGGTFITLQQLWGQIRLILIYVPLILMFFWYGIIELSKTKKSLRTLQILFTLFFILTLGKIFSKTTDKVKENQEILAKNIQGKKYYGYTPDWQHFLQMSEWVSENLPDTAGVLSRKSSMSFIYGDGFEFVGVYRFPIYSPEEVVEQVKKKSANTKVVKTDDLKAADIPVRIQMAMARMGEGYLYGEGEMFGIYDYSNPAMEPISDYLTEQGISQKELTAEFLEMINSSEKTYVGVLPDSLVADLKNKEVDYLIRGSLRVIPTQKTGRTINTVSRYMYFIQLKYPGIFEKVHQIGADNDEPAILYRIHYDRYGL